ncbi:MAG: hypothetical protein WBF34_40890, partial [Streptosporangiaceae bacterium]
MPVAWDEFTADELRQIMADSRGQAEDILALAHDLEVKLPGTGLEQQPNGQWRLAGLRGRPRDPEATGSRKVVARSVDGDRGL